MVCTRSPSRGRTGIEFAFTFVLLGDLEVVDSGSESAIEIVMSTASGSSCSLFSMSSSEAWGNCYDGKDGEDVWGRVYG